MSSVSPGQLMLFAPSPPAPRAVQTRRNHRRSTKTTAAGLRFCVLGSGSGGNCSVITSGGRAMLIDAGFGPRTTAYRLAQLGLTLDDLEMICLTHLDRDHFRPTWVGTLLRHRIRVCVHQWHVEDFRRVPGSTVVEGAGLLEAFDGRPAPMLTNVVSHAIRLPHDKQGTCGFLLETPAGRLGYATDLGRVPEALIERFTGVDVLALESNYDPRMQRESSRPAFLKHRIMGGKGHLSNEEAFTAVQRIAGRSPDGLPRHIVLLHRSAQCNSLRRIEAAFGSESQLWRRVTLTHQRRRSRIITLGGNGAHGLAGRKWSQPPLPWEG